MSCCWFSLVLFILGLFLWAFFLGWFLVFYISPFWRSFHGTFYIFSFINERLFLVIKKCCHVMCIHVPWQCFLDLAFWIYWDLMNKMVPRFAWRNKGWWDEKGSFQNCIEDYNQHEAWLDAGLVWELPYFLFNFMLILFEVDFEY